MKRIKFRIETDLVLAIPEDVEPTFVQDDVATALIDVCEEYGVDVDGSISFRHANGKKLN